MGCGWFESSCPDQPDQGLVRQSAVGSVPGDPLRKPASAAARGNFSVPAVLCNGRSPFALPRLAGQLEAIGKGRRLVRFPLAYRVRRGAADPRRLSGASAGRLPNRRAWPVDKCLRNRLRDRARGDSRPRPLQSGPHFLALEQDIGDHEQQDHGGQQRGQLRPHHDKTVGERQRCAADRALDLR
jgi:hypothetical protein